MDPIPKKTPRKPSSCLNGAELPETPCAGKLSQAVTSEPSQWTLLVESLSRLSAGIYTAYKARFEESLSHEDRDIYRGLCSLHYAQKDWWRDHHDIIVTRSLALIVQRENLALPQLPLPKWLVTAALVHDRGYAALAHATNANSQNYQARLGAHWENRDTRIIHSALSREIADTCLFGSDPVRLQAAPYNIIGKLPCSIPAQEHELFLQVVERHDHALIERYEDIPEVGHHHFDADSLFSISLASFVKDYLSYLGDPKKLAQLSDAGVLQDGFFSLRTFLSIRLARYYPSAPELPTGWEATGIQIRENGHLLNEGKRCLPPHSQTARDMTDKAFVRLAECVEQFEKSDSVEQFCNWLQDAMRAEMLSLFAP